MNDFSYAKDANMVSEFAGSKKMLVSAHGSGITAVNGSLQYSALEPEDIRRVVQAYEHALQQLAVADTDDCLKQLVAKLVFGVAQTGEQDPQKIASIALSYYCDARRVA
jgi:hypothetical protein